MENRIPLRHKCAYRGCVKTKWDKNVHLFRFPGDDERRAEWIENSGNDRLVGLKKCTIMLYGICDKHFTSKSFTNSDRNRLNWNAKPIPYQWTPKTIPIENGKRRAGLLEQEFSFDCSNDKDRVFVIHEKSHKQSHIFEEKRRMIPVIKPLDKSLQPKNELLRRGITPSTTTFNIYEDRNSSKLIVTRTNNVLKDENSILDRTSSPESRKQPVELEISKEKERYKATIDDLEHQNELLHVENGEMRKTNKKLHVKFDKLMKKNEEQARKIRRLRYDLRQQAKKHEQAKQNMTINEFLSYQDPPLNPAAQTLVRMQFHEPNTPFTDDQQELAKHVYNYSASLYKRIRQLGITLPGQSTVHGWVKGCDMTGSPGLSDQNDIIV